jgi:hypothetical protein
LVTGEERLSCALQTVDSWSDRVGPELATLVGGAANVKT